MTERLKVLYAGTPATAVIPLDALVERDDLDVVAVLTREDAPVGRKKVLTPSPVAQRAEELNIPTLKANRATAELVDQLRATGAEIAAVVAYGALLPRPVLDAFEHGWINLHFSLLPQWRGAAPVQRALMAGDTMMGATTFVLDEGMDTAPSWELSLIPSATMTPPVPCWSGCPTTDHPCWRIPWWPWPRGKQSPFPKRERPARPPNSPGPRHGSTGTTLPWPSPITCAV